MSEERKIGPVGADMRAYRYMDSYDVGSNYPVRFVETRLAYECADKADAEIARLTALLAEAREGLERAERALHPFADYSEKRRIKPLPQLGDSIHSIHTGGDYAAELTTTHTAAALAAWRATGAILAKLGA